jgi:phage terminase large subunit-like protein
MIEGVSGLMSVYPPQERPKLEVSRNQLVWANGTMAQLFGADDPDSLRGPQFDADCGPCSGVATLRGF